MNGPQLRHWLTACAMLATFDLGELEHCVPPGSVTRVWLDRVVLADAAERESITRLQALRALHARLYGRREA